MKKYANTRLERQELLIPDDDVTFLGPQLVVQDCVVTFQCSARALGVHGVEFLDSKIVAKRTLSNFAFEQARFVNTNFAGTFTGCDFGSRVRQKGVELLNCDFSSADLRNCRFFNCDLNELKLPKWPCFTIPTPSRKTKELLGLDWPNEKIRAVIQTYAAQDKSCTALTSHIKVLEKYGGDFDSNVVKEMLMHAGWIVL